MSSKEELLVLVKTDFFTIYITENGLESGHSDGVGFCGDLPQEEWVKVYQALHKYFQESNCGAA